MGRKSSEISSQDVFPRHSNRTSLNFADDTPVCNEWTISLLESRDVTHQVGLAAINNNTGRITLTQVDLVFYNRTCANYNYLVYAMSSDRFAILSTYAKKDTPSTILVCSTSVGKNQVEQSSKSLLVSRLLEYHKPANVKSIQRKHFNDIKGLDNIDNFILKDVTKDAKMMVLRSKYYAVAAASALFSYLDSVQTTVFAPNSLSISYQEHKGTMFIESQTAQDLELTTSAVGNAHGMSLLSLLDSCLSQMGRRLLRSSILQPLSDAKIIENRLDAIQELLLNGDILNAIRSSFKSLKGIDLEKLLMAISKDENKSTAQDHEVEKRISQLLTIRSAIHAISNIYYALDGAKSSLLTSLRNDLHDDAFNCIISAIDENIEQDVTLGKSGSLAARNAKIYAIKSKQCELLDVAREAYRENLDDLFALSTKYTDLGNGDLPKEFINVTKYGSKGKNKNNSENMAGRYRFTTIDLLKRNSRINDALAEVYLLSKQRVLDIRIVVIGCLSPIYRASDAIAMLDLIVSLTNAALIRDYSTDTLALKSARHPLLENLNSETIVSNDVFMSDFAHFQIIEGPNMSDEIGRGTTPSEGFGLAYAISEELIRRRPFVIFATHFRQLSTYLQFKPGVVTLHMATTVGGSDEIYFQYKVAEGNSVEQHYGLQMAKSAGLPGEVLDEAHVIVRELSSENEHGYDSVINQARKMATRRQAVLSVTSKLRQICKNCALNYQDLMVYLARLQSELVLSLEGTGMGDPEVASNVNEKVSMESNKRSSVSPTSSPMFISEDEAEQYQSDLSL
ncbi:hypothetical protein E3Q22_01587 [Wallemia mellicola]|uniref:DNA mismatch repair proteins mutS family domain-containing protein n=2 Tax=Wallemia mellicola TaxID=1708541 RepID=A0A4T0MCZ0_9BASI|nr:hypothetical protein E3Q22_01587 [Wallemia mellicola]